MLLMGVFRARIPKKNLSATRISVQLIVKLAHMAIGLFVMLLVELVRNLRNEKFLLPIGMEVEFART
jgi:hypothetical protein